MEEMNIWVTGATGYVGKALIGGLVRDLRIRGKIYCLVREESYRKLSEYKDRVEVVGVDFGSDEELSFSFGVGGSKDVLIHLVSILRESADKKYIDYNYLIGKKLIDYGKRKGLRRMILMSAAGAPPFLEGYIKWKEKAEEYLEESGLEWVILKPSLIYNASSFRGKNLGYLSYLESFYELGGKLPYIGDKVSKWTPVSRKKLIGVILEILLNWEKYRGKRLYSDDFV